MIPAHGYVAIYAHQRDGREHVVRRPVIAWHTDTGRPLVVDPEEHRLVPAHTIAGFDGLRQAPETAYVPGGGWMATYSDIDGQRTAPVIAWKVDDFGQVEPRVYYKPDESKIDDMKVWHPDHAETQPAIAAAIVIHDRRVLLARRRVPEGPLVWTFPAGKVEPGETGEDAAVRETREEVGLEVSAVKTLGDRIHPATGRRMIYVVCSVLAGEAHVADADELAAVEWCSRERVAELVPFPFYGPVQEYLDGHLT